MTRRTMSVSRRGFLKTSAAAASTLAVGTYLPRAWAADPMKVSSYGGYFEDSLSEKIFPEFTKQTGIPIESVSQQGGNSWFTVIKTGLASGKAPTDISMCGGQAARRFQELFEPLDEKRIPNLANLPDNLITRDADGAVRASAVLSWYTTFVTNTETFPEPPKSWGDAWDPKYKDSLGWGANADSSYLLDITAVTFFGGQEILKSKDGLEKVMRKAAELRSNVTLWYRDEGQFQQALQTGEIPAGQYYHDVTNLAAADGFPVVSTFPKEGGVLDFGSWVVIKGSKHIDAAHQFINWCCEPAVQADITRKLGTAPTVPRSMTDLTDEEFNFASSPIAPIVPAYDVYVEHGDWISERWKELISGASG